jgi:phosphatidylglycerol:prolipoprotein diacylglycerol transferase
MLEAFQNLFAPSRHMLFLVAAAWLGLTLSERRAERHTISKDDLNNLVFFGLLAFVLGGRLVSVLQNIAIFAQKPLDIFSINANLFDSPGAFAFALLAAAVYGQRSQIGFWNSLDALTPFFAVFAVGLGLSHLADGTIHGTPTSAPWGIQFQDETTHPVSHYEVLASLLTLGWVWRFGQNPRPGIIFLSFAALTSASQILLQAFYPVPSLLLGQYRNGQVFAWAALLLCFILIESRLGSESRTG